MLKLSPHSSFVYRIGGYVRRIAFIVMSLFCGTVVLIGWGIPQLIMVVCRSTWGHGWRTLFAITCDIRVTLRTLRPHNNLRLVTSYTGKMATPGENGQRDFFANFTDPFTTDVTRN